MSIKGKFKKFYLGGILMQIKDKWVTGIPGDLYIKSYYVDLTDMSSIKNAMYYIREYGYHNKGAVTKFFHTVSGHIYVKVTNGKTFEQCRSTMDGKRLTYFCQRIEIYKIK